MSGSKEDKNLIDSTNVINLKRDEVLLDSIAEERFENGDYLGALSIYLNIEECGKFNPILYQKIADLYTQLNMHDDSVNYWFKYLDCVTKRHYVDAYNGLGANYLLMGEQVTALYYFNLQINDKYDTDLPYDDYMYDLFGEVGRPSNIKLVDSQGENDSKTISLAKQLFSEDREGAIKLLKAIESNSSQYGEAQCVLAAFALFSERYESAIEAYSNCLSVDYLKEYALNNLYALYLFTGNVAEAERVFNLISQLKCGNFEHLSKYLLLFDAKDLHQLNYDFSKAILDIAEFTPSIYFILGVSAFNLGDFEQAKHYFCEYNSVKRNHFSKWCCSVAYDALNGQKGCYTRLSYSYYLPEKECEKLVKKADKYMNSSQSTLRKKCKEVLDFAEGAFFTKRLDLQMIVCQILAIIGNLKVDKFFKEQLLKQNIDDAIKSFILTMLVEIGNDKPTGLVFGNVYTKIKFERIEFTEGNGDVFKYGYALAFGKLAPVFSERIYKLKVMAYDLYYKLLANGNLRKVNDVQALAALIALKCEFMVDKNEKGLFEYFLTTKQKVNKLLKLLEAE